MKKNYVKPTIEVELAEAGELMTGSNPKGNADVIYGGGGDGKEHQLGNNISGTGDDDDFFQGAKGGIFTCWEDEGDWAL